MNKVYEKLYKKYKSGTLSEENLNEALKIFDTYDNRKDEMKEYQKMYLFIGISLLLSSVFYFVAYNWREIHDYGKFSIVLLLMTLSLIVYLLKIKELYRKLGLFSLGFLIGILFALFGQVYQTGADSYVLFITWSLGILPMTLVSRSYLMYLLLFITSTIGASILIGKLGGVYAFSIISNLIPLLIMIIFDKQKKSFKGKEVFRGTIGILFIIYHFLANVYYAITGPFIISLTFYTLWIMYIFRKKEIYKKGYRIFSLVPIFILSPTAIIWTSIKLEVFESSPWENVIIFNLIFIITSYVLLSKGIIKIKKEGEDE